MANRLMTMSYNSSLNARNLLHNYYKNRPLAEIENTYNIHLEDDPFDYKKLVKRPETRTSQATRSDDELIKRAIKSAPVLRAAKKQQSDAKSDFSTTRSAKSSLPLQRTKKKRLNDSKIRSKSANNDSSKSEAGQFLILPMDEFSYRQRRKQLSQQIHEHWNQDSSQLSKNTKSQEKIEQWMPIVNENNAVDNTTRASLIDTFSNAKNADTEKVYHVSNEIGSMIAQKMDHGVKLLICRNGEPVKSNRRASSLSNSSKDEANKANPHRISQLFDEMNVIPIQPLSWNDQVGKSGHKVLSPRKVEEKTIEKPVHERKLFVKKLIEEDEFRPKLKQELANKYQLQQNTKPKLPTTVNTMFSSNSLNSMAKVTSVEIIGVSQNKPSAMPTETYFKPDSTQAPPPTASMPTLVPSNNQNELYNDNSENILSERQYNQIIDNLTKQYLTHKRSQLFSSNADGSSPMSHQPPPPPPTTTRTTTALASAMTMHHPAPTPQQQQQQQAQHVRINFTEVEMSNRKRQALNSNVNKAYNQMMLNNLRMAALKEQTKSRPNSPDLSINLSRRIQQQHTAQNEQPQHKPEKPQTAKSNSKTETNVQTIGSRQSTQNSIMRVNPYQNSISKALKSAKQKANSAKGDNDAPMFIRITTSLEPANRHNSITNRTFNQVTEHIGGSRNRSSLHNPSFTTLSDTPVPSRLY